MVFQDLLTNKDDYLRASRALLREIIKQTKHEINFQSFCFGLMQERKEPTYVDMEFKVSILALRPLKRLCWTLFSPCRSALSSRSPICWPSPWCWGSQLRSKKPALRGTKERRRVSYLHDTGWPKKKKSNIIWNMNIVNYMLLKWITQKIKQNDTKKPIVLYWIREKKAEATSVGLCTVWKFNPVILLQTTRGSPPTATRNACATRRSTAWGKRN